ncbi:MAG: DUF4412 domain-containing protein [Desulfarculaceae bacterium]|nr:DUF4412 domain-containing protein [Desulfarculaceae bacterium]MCF8072497.1 DUF4412 domain-containing protein [Desulfarculaceae bacterium]MCF8102958.1 DUF4412 domain-containing protein [Desulfarculaceae bacterium]MCF8117038.1 DUF4412 domain-containing protein [Desulfarculaceae bacterium]
MTIRACLTTLAVLLMATTAQAGWVMQQQTPGGTSTVYMQDNMMRAGEGQQGMIYDLNQGTVTMLNPGNKVYWSGRPSELNQQMDQALDERMEQALKSVPPEQREQMRAMMAQRMGRGGPGGPGGPGGTMGHQRPAPTVEIKATGENQKIAGYKAQMYQVWVNGRHRQDIWMAPVAGFHDELDMGKMMKLVHAMRMGGPGRRPRRASWRTSPAMMELWQKGMPMMITDYGPGGPKTMMKVTKVEEKGLDQSIFAPPAGYKRVDFKNMMR